MATKVPIPKLGQSEETVVIEKWRVREGDEIKKGNILFEVETDKAVLEVESQFEGTLLKVVIPAGKEVPVMSIAAVIGEKGEAIPEIEQPKMPEPEKKAPTPVPASQKKAAPEKKAVPAAAASAPATAPQQSLPASPPLVPAPAGKKIKPSPRARLFARDYIIDLDRIQGTGGDSGRVTEGDVKRYLEESGYFEKKITPAAFNLAKNESLHLPDIEGSGERGRVTLADVRDAVMEKPREFSTMRRIIAQRLTQSKQTIPHFYVTVSIDMTELQKKRQELKEQGISLSVNVFIFKAVALALKEFPMLNSETDGISYRTKSKVNIGMAVSLEKGLVVPVIRNADKKALDEIQAESAEFAQKARDGKISPDDMKGGTFTISNMGMLGVENFAAIINPGESAILAVSSSVPTPVVVEGEIVIRDMMKITLSADHRTVDGAEGARFVNAIKEKLEDSAFWDSQI